MIGGCPRLGKRAWPRAILGAVPDLLASLAAPVAARLVARGDSVGVSESSTGNAEPTAMDDLVDAPLRGSIGQLLPRLVDAD